MGERPGRREGVALRERRGNPLARVRSQELPRLRAGSRFAPVRAAVVRTAWVPQPISYLMGLSGLTYLAQGWVAGSEGFWRMHTIAIVLAWVLNPCVDDLAGRRRPADAGFGAHFDNGWGLSGADLSATPVTTDLFFWPLSTTVAIWNHLDDLSPCLGDVLRPD